MRGFAKTLPITILAAVAGCSSSPFGVRPEIDQVSDDGKGRGEITIFFEIWDDDLTWPSVAVEYRASDGILRKATLTDASVEGVEARVDSKTGNVMLIERWVADWTPCTVTWDSLADDVALGGEGDVTIRLTPSDFDGVGVAVEHTFKVNNLYPTLHVDKTGLAFECVEGSGVNPAAQVVKVENTGPDQTTLVWSVDAATLETWLSADPAGGTLAWDAQPVSVTLSVDAAGLAVGVYDAFVEFRGENPGGAPAHGSPFTLHVTLTVRAPEPAISIVDSGGGTLTDLYFTATPGGGNPASQSFFVKNSGEAGSVLSWTATDGPGSNTWLSYAPTSGSTAAGSSTEVVVSVDVGSLGTGTYTAEITVTAPGAAGSPKTLTVHLTVGQAPALSVAPASLTFSATEGGSNPAAQALSISNPGGGTLSWSVSEAAGWLSLAPTSGECTTETDAVTVSVDISGLAAATHNATITISAPGAANSPLTVSAALTLAPATSDPAISVSPTSLEFTATKGGSNPPDQTLSIANSGGGNLNWSLVDDAGWLTLSPIFGECTSETDSVTLSVDISGLVGGKHNGTITVTAPGAANSPQTVPVTVTVGGEGLAKGLVAHWKFDETSGTTAYDSSGSNHHGTLVNGPVWQPAGGQIGGALSFDGSDDSVDCGTEPIWDLTSYTVASWFRTDDSSNFRVVACKSLGTPARNFWIGIWRDGDATHPGGSVVFRTSSGGVEYAVDLDSGGDAADGQWHHLAAVMGGSGMAELYVDGTLRDSAASPGPPDTPAAPVIIGDDPNAAARHFLGLIDDVRIYDRVLSATEIAELGGTGAQYKIVDLVTHTVTSADIIADLLTNDAYKTTKLVLKRISAGTFQMGDEVGGHSQAELPVHAVNITKAFYIGVFELTQRQWYEVEGTWPSRFTTTPDKRPVENISWDDCQGFLTQLSAVTALTARLPTEAEWEYACKAGTTTNYSYGNTEDGSYMWYDANSGLETHEVGTRYPNPWGLYDMHGNVFEWCEDWYESAYYSVSPADDPQGPTGGVSRVVRSYSWQSPASDCRSSRRGAIGPSGRFRTLGLRAALTAP